MIEEFEIRGEWWLGRSPEMKAAGGLHFNPREGAKLELNGRIRAGTSPFPETFILGESTTGDEITLYGCEPLGGTSSFRGSGTSSFQAMYIFNGIHFKSRDDMRFINSSVRFNNLDEWVGKYGFKQRIGKNGFDYLVGYKAPNRITVPIDDNIDLSIGFRYSSRPQGYKKYLLEQETVISFRSKEPIDYLNYSELTFHFQNLLTLAITLPIYPIQIKFTYIDETENSEKDIDFFFRLNQIPDINNPVHALHMLFSLKDIEEELVEYLQNWYKKRARLNPIVDLYFGTFYNPHMYMQTRFLNIIQGIESYDRRLGNNAEIDPAKYEKKIGRIYSKLSSRDKSWLKWKLKYANEPSLKSRLVRVFKARKERIVPMVGSLDAFVEKVKNTRNYLTHFDEELEDLAAHGGELGGITQTLTMLLESILLEELGFKPDKVTEMQRNRSRLPFY